MSIEFYYPAERKITEYVHTVKPNKKFINVYVYRSWIHHTGTDCSCGDSKDLIIERKFGIEDEFYKETNKEIGSSIEGGLTSISAKASEKTSQKLNIIREQRIESKDTIKAPTCGKKRIDLYQLRTRWQIESHDQKRKWILWKRDDVRNIYFYMDENIWRTFYTLTDPDPECGKDCQSKGSYNGVVTLETDNGLLTLPGNISADSISIYGINKQFKKGDTLKIDEIPQQISGDIITRDKEAKIIDAKAHYSFKQSAARLDDTNHHGSIPKDNQTEIKDPLAKDETYSKHTVSKELTIVYYIAGASGDKSQIAVTVVNYINLSSLYDRSQLPEVDRRLLQEKDLYYVSLECSFLPTKNERILNCAVAIDFNIKSKPDAQVLTPVVVHDLFPREVLEKVSFETVKLSGLHVEAQSLNKNKADREGLNDINYNDAIVASGIGTSKATWKFQNLAKGILGIKKLYLILQAPKNSKVKGRISITTEVSSYILNKIKLPDTRYTDLITNAELILYDPQLDSLSNTSP